MAAHRAQQLLSMLPSALSTGFSDIDEPLKVRILFRFTRGFWILTGRQNFDSSASISMPDTPAQFYLSGLEGNFPELYSRLSVLQNGWTDFKRRADSPDNEWVADLSDYLDNIAGMRVEHVREWINTNISRFKTSHANIGALHRAFDSATLDLRANVQVCKVKCTSCHLFCLKPRGHEAYEIHDCRTDHACGKLCDYGEEHSDEEKCGYP
jgi:hypothetical protein